MVEWCTQNLRRNGSISRSTSQATSTERYQYTTSVNINNACYKRIQSFIQNHMPVCTVRLLESREQSYIKAMNNNIQTLDKAICRSEGRILSSAAKWPLPSRMLQSS